MDLGFPPGLTVYKLLQDQGSVIAGGFALVAGWAVYRAGLKQARAVEGQNRELKRNENRRLARETLIAARLIDGALATVQQNIDAISPFERTIGIVATQKCREGLQPLNIEPLIDQLGRLNRETIDKYFLLRNSIEKFRMAAGEMAVHRELEIIQLNVDFLRDELGRESTKAEYILRQMEGK